MKNCLTYALRRWRYALTSHYLLIRKSRWAWFPHFAVLREARDGSLEKREYIPLAPRRQRFPPPSFAGRVKTTRYARVELRRGTLVVYAAWAMPVQVVRSRGKIGEGKATWLRPGARRFP